MGAGRYPESEMASRGGLGMISRRIPRFGQECCARAGMDTVHDVSAKGRHGVGLCVPGSAEQAGPLGCQSGARARRVGPAGQGLGVKCSVRYVCSAFAAFQQASTPLGFVVSAVPARQCPAGPAWSAREWPRRRCCRFRRRSRLRHHRSPGRGRRCRCHSRL